jgi:hypothetical protein
MLENRLVRLKGIYLRIRSGGKRTGKAIAIFIFPKTKGTKVNEIKSPDLCLRTGRDPGHIKKDASKKPY